MPRKGHTETSALPCIAYRGHSWFAWCRRRGRKGRKPIPLDARRMRGFRVDFRPMVSILTTKSSQKHRQCRAGRSGPRNTTAGREKMPSLARGGKSRFPSGNILARCVMKNGEVGKSRLVSFIFILLGSSILGCGCNFGDAPTMTTEYQAVFLDSGQIFFGKIENVGSKYPLLKDVYYIQRQEDTTTKQVRDTLIKRGNELHAPDIMYLNARHITVIESVTPNSKVYQLIKDAKSQKTSSTP